MRQLHVFDLHALHLDAPVVGGLIQVGLEKEIHHGRITSDGWDHKTPRMAYLHAVGDALAVRQELGQVLGAQDIPEGGLSQQAGGEVSVGHVGHGGDGVTDAEVHHAVDADRNRVLGQDLWWATARECTSAVARGYQRRPSMEGRYLLWWDVKGNCSQVNFHEGIGARQNEEDACYKRGKQMIFSCFAVHGR